MSRHANKDEAGGRVVEGAGALSHAVVVGDEDDGRLSMAGPHEEVAASGNGQDLA
jgi:hypothetical protein